MRVAFLILAHHYPEQLRRLLHTLDDPRFDLFVHVDAKADIQQFRFDTYQLRCSQLKIIHERIHSYWGDISLLEAMLVLYRNALAEKEYDWFVTLSGEDYPILSNDAICDYLQQQKDDCICLTKLHLEERIRKYWFWKIPNRFLGQLIRKSLYVVGIRKKSTLIVDGKKWRVCVASQWHALRRANVEHVLSVLDDHPEILKYFRYSHAPDEMVIPTILYNSSPYTRNQEEYPDNLRLRFNEMSYICFLEYNRQKGSSVTVFDESVYSAAIASGKMFIRKVRMGKSDKLMDMLDEFRKPKG